MSVIASDLDDVIWDLRGPWCRKLNETHGLSVNVDEMDAWRFATFFPTLTSKQMFAPINDHSIYKELVINPGAAETIQRLISDGHHVVIASSTYYTNWSDKIAALHEKLPFFNMRDVIAIADKSLLNADFLIDDAPHNISTFPRTGILFDGPHNRNYPLPQGAYRAVGWDGVYETINMVLDGRV